jgi:teichuronic acid biosynthesis glycosyltransferase TuaH
MALEKPIITTAMKECKKYKSIFIANNAEEFISLTDKALKINKKNNKDYYELLKKEALDNTWNKKAEEIMYLLKKEENK